MCNWDRDSGGIAGGVSSLGTENGSGGVFDDGVAGAVLLLLWKVGEAAEWEMQYAHHALSTRDKKAQRGRMGEGKEGRPSPTRLLESKQETASPLEMSSFPINTIHTIYTYVLSSILLLLSFEHYAPIATKHS